MKTNSKMKIIIKRTNSKNTWNECYKPRKD